MSSTLSLTTALDEEWVSTTRCTPGEEPVSIVQGAGWAPGPVWSDAEKFTPTGIQSPERPARSESLYRLRYPDPHSYTCGCIILVDAAREWQC